MWIRKKREPEIDPCGTFEKILIKSKDVIYLLDLVQLLNKVIIVATYLFEVFS